SRSRLCARAGEQGAQLEAVEREAEPGSEAGLKRAACDPAVDAHSGYERERVARNRIATGRRFDALKQRFERGERERPRHAGTVTGEASRRLQLEPALPTARGGELAEERRRARRLSRRGRAQLVVEADAQAVDEANEDRVATVDPTIRVDVASRRKREVGKCARLPQAGSTADLRCSRAGESD